MEHLLFYSVPYREFAQSSLFKDSAPKDLACVPVSFTPVDWLRGGCLLNWIIRSFSLGMLGLWWGSTNVSVHAWTEKVLRIAYGMSSVMLLEEDKISLPKEKNEVAWQEQRQRPCKLREEQRWERSYLGFWWVCVLGSSVSMRPRFCLNKSLSGLMWLVINIHISLRFPSLFVLSLSLNRNFMWVEIRIACYLLYCHCSDESRACIEHSVNNCWMNSSPASDYQLQLSPEWLFRFTVFSTFWESKLARERRIWSAALFQWSGNVSRCPQSWHLPSGPACGLHNHHCVTVSAWLSGPDVSRIGEYISHIHISMVLFLSS